MARTKQRIHAGQALEFFASDGIKKGTVQQVTDDLVLIGNPSVAFGDGSNVTDIIIANASAKVQFNGTLPFYDSNATKNLITLSGGTVIFNNQGAGASPILEVNSSSQILGLTGQFSASSHIITATNFKLKSGTAFDATIQHSNDAARAYTLPNLSGVVTLGTGAANKLVRWDNVNQVSNTPITESSGSLSDIVNLTTTGLITSSGGILSKNSADVVVLELENSDTPLNNSFEDSPRQRWIATYDSDAGAPIVRTEVHVDAKIIMESTVPEYRFVLLNHTSTEIFSVDESGNIGDINSLTLSGQLISTVTTGTAPLVIASTTVIPNLNADMTDGFHLDQNVTIASTPTFGGLTLAGNLNMQTNDILINGGDIGTVLNRVGTLYATNLVATNITGDVELDITGTTSSFYSINSDASTSGESAQLILRGHDGTSQVNNVLKGDDAGIVVLTLGKAAGNFQVDDGTDQTIISGVIVTSKQLESTIAIGTPPLIVTSTTVVPNLNVDQVDGFDLDQDVTTSGSPTFAGLALGTGNITMTGDIGTNVNKVDDIWVTNLHADSISGALNSTVSETFTVNTDAPTGGTTATLILKTNSSIQATVAADSAGKLTLTAQAGQSVVVEGVSFDGGIITDVTSLDGASGSNLQLVSRAVAALHDIELFANQTSPTNGVVAAGEVPSLRLWGWDDADSALRYTDLVVQSVGEGDDRTVSTYHSYFKVGLDPTGGKRLVLASASSHPKFTTAATHPELWIYDNAGTKGLAIVASDTAFGGAGILLNEAQDGQFTISTPATSADNLILTLVSDESNKDNWFEAKVFNDNSLVTLTANSDIRIHGIDITKTGQKIDRVLEINPLIDGGIEFWKTVADPSTGNSDHLLTLYSWDHAGSVNSGFGIGTFSNVVTANGDELVQAWVKLPASNVLSLTSDSARSAGMELVSAESHPTLRLWDDTNTNYGQILHNSNDLVLQTSTGGVHARPKDGKFRIQDADDIDISDYLEIATVDGSGQVVITTPTNNDIVVRDIGFFELENPNSPSNNSMLDSPQLILTGSHDSDAGGGITRTEDQMKLQVVVQNTTPEYKFVILNTSNTEVFGVDESGNAQSPFFVGGNVTSGADPGHTHTSSSITIVNVEVNLEITGGAVTAGTNVNLGQSIPSGATVFLDGTKLRKDSNGTANDNDYWISGQNINFTFTIPNNSFIEVHWAE